MYNSGWRQYTRFCTQYLITPLPLTEASQAAFAAHLSQSVSPRTIQSYLCAIRFFHIRAGLPEPSGISSPRLNYVLKGIQRTSMTPTKPKRLPITPHLLERIHTLWSKDQLSFDKTMLWAAFCLGFFGFMRSGEFTCSPSGNPSDCTLTASDIQVDSRTNPTMISILLRRSKTDPFGTGTYLYIGRTGTAICPVSALLAYLAIRSPNPGPLFVFQDGTPLSRQHLVAHLRKALEGVGVDVTNYSGHSFRIGAASTAARAGFSDSFIQKLGRWKSPVFTTYIRTPVEDLVAASAILANPPRGHS